MARRRHTPDQVIRKLREGEKLLGEGKDLAEACEHLEISGASWHRWRNQYGGMKADEAKRLRELERENGRLKKLVADQALDIDILKEVNRGNSEPGAQTPGGDYGFGAIRRFRATCMSRHRTISIHPEVLTAGTRRSRAPATSATAGHFQEAHPMGLPTGNDVAETRRMGREQEESPAPVA